jgi:hypothetical protein
LQDRDVWLQSHFSIKRGMGWVQAKVRRGEEVVSTSATEDIPFRPLQREWMIVGGQMLAQRLTIQGPR